MQLLVAALVMALTMAFSGVGRVVRRRRVRATSIVVTPSAHKTFTPRELAVAYKQFEKLGPQHLDAETGIKAGAYRFDERVLLVYEEAETGLVVLIHPSASKVNSP